jgi:hypothetical protein
MKDLILKLKLNLEKNTESMDNNARLEHSLDFYEIINDINNEIIDNNQSARDLILSLLSNSQILYVYNNIDIEEHSVIGNLIIELHTLEIPTITSLNNASLLTATPDNQSYHSILKYSGITTTKDPSDHFYIISILNLIKNKYYS